MPVYSTTILSSSTILDLDTTSENTYISRSGFLFTLSSDPTIVGSNSSEVVVVNGEIGGFGNAILLMGDFSRIVVGSSGIVNSTVYGDKAAANLWGDNSEFFNDGTISGGIGVSFYGSGSVLTNNGQITAYGESLFFAQAGVFMVDYVGGSATASTFEVNNYGTISGQEYSIFAGELSAGANFATSAVVNNFGTLEGGVFLGLGEDVVVNAGLINGDVEMGGDDDLYRGFLAGVVIGTVRGEGGIDRLIGSSAQDDFDGGSGNDMLYGRGGDDFLVGGLGADFVYGGNGDDIIIGGGNGANSLFGGRGDDVITASDGGDEAYGGRGKDFIHGGSSGDQLFGGDGEDVLNGGGGTDNLRGGKEDDVINGDGGRDYIYGQNGDDVLNGGGGGDRIFGGRGDDIMRGNNGSDRFIFDFKSGSDLILDFTNGSDKLDFSAYGIDFFDALNAAVMVAGNLDFAMEFISGEAGAHLILQGFDIVDLDASDILF